jgi:hypothetical protein
VPQEVAVTEDCNPSHRGKEGGVGEKTRRRGGRSGDAVTLSKSHCKAGAEEGTADAT